MIEQLGAAQHGRANRHVDVTDVDRRGSDRGSRDRERRQQQGIAAFEREIDGGPELCPEPHGSDIVLGKDVAPHLEAQPDAGRIEIGVFVKRSRVVARRFRQADVKVHIRRDRRRLDRDLAQRVARFADTTQRLLQTGARLRLDPVEEIGPWNSEGQRSARRRDLMDGHALHRLEQQGRIGNRPGERPDVIERGAEGDHAVTGDLAERRLQSDDATGGGRNADGAARVGAHRAEAHALGHRCRRTAARSACRPRGIDRITDRTERGLVAGRAERELVQVRFADDDRPGVAQPAHDGCVRRRGACRHSRPGRRRRARDIDEILDRDRDAVQRSAIPPARDLAVSAFGVRECRLPHQQRKCVQLRPRFRPCQGVSDEIDRRKQYASERGPRRR